MSKPAVNAFRAIAFLEGISYILLLFIAVPLKRIWDRPEFVEHIGLAHGILFVAYVLYLFYLKFGEYWSFKDVTLSFIASLLPFGTFIADKRIFRKYL